VLAALPLATAGIAACLAAAGLGLGVFVPANNAVLMHGAPAASAAVLGGLVSAARGIGTTLGIALVAVALHAAGPALALALLAGAAAAAVLVALAGGPPSARPPGAAQGTKLDLGPPAVMR
jgi:hypothetical protein